jgi:hypothetical protein
VINLATTAISKELLEQYVSSMNKRALSADEFIILMPISVYEYIKHVGINADFMEFRPNSVDMIWIRVMKLKEGI